MQTKFYIGSDYAGIETKNAYFYYGCERTERPDDEEDEGDWCFVADTFVDKEIVIPFSKLLGVRDMFNVEKCLLAGIAMVLEEFKLEKNNG